MAGEAWRVGAPPLRALSRSRLRRAVPGVVCRTRTRRLRGVCLGAAVAPATPADAERLPGFIGVLVPVVPELAERVPGNRVDGLAGGVSAAAVVAGVEAGACAASRDRPVTRAQAYELIADSR